MMKIIKIFLLLVILLPIQVGHAIQDPFEFSLKKKTYLLKPQETVSIDIFFNIPKDHYLYKDKTAIRLLEGDGLELKAIRYPPSVIKKDPFLGRKLEIYKESSRVTVELRAKSSAPLGRQKITLELIYQGCSPKFCFRRNSRTFEFPIRIISTGEKTTKVSAQKAVEFYLTEALNAKSWLAYLFAFVGGFLTDFTPCVIPLIPLTLAVIGLRRERRHRRNFFLTSVLVLAMVLTYALLGVLVSLLGLQLGFLFQSPFFLLIGAILFIVFALGLFGVYELQMPLWLRNRMAKLGGQGYWGATLAGMTIGILAAPCVGPVIGALLVWVAQTTDVSYGFGLLFSFGLGMGSLILVVGTFYSSLASRIHGGVLSLWVQRFLGVLLLLPALYYGYIAYAGFRAMSDVAQIEKGAVSWIIDYKDAIKKAQAHDRPILIDFYADWCLPCLEWQQETFSDNSVQERLKRDFVQLRIDCTKNTTSCKEAVERYQIVGWPTILVTDPQGRVIEGSRLVGEVLGPEEFLQYLGRWGKTE